MAELIECVPNISEGVRTEVVDAVVDALSSIPGAVLLDRSSDADHNRTVLTLAGTREGLKIAIRALYAAAIPAIDLRAHKGGHPRMGAVDVVPFIPIQGATMADCVALSREVGEMVANEFDVPMFLYADAAVSPERKILANIRKGEFEGLATKLADPAWKPDYGPSTPHPTAGVTAIGARFFLIAYNLQLDTADVKIAKAIAKGIRESSGSMTNVQAMGLYLPGRNQAQVSMNLLNYEKTPIHRVQEVVKLEAARYGAHVVSAEIVGLIPQAALLNSAAHYLQIENWNQGLVLENAVWSKKEMADG